MAITKEQNDLLTQVENGAPMGEMLRQYYWFPAIISMKVESGGKPVPLRLIGRDLVAFRTPSGKVGIIDEKCPHRRTSLLLARNEEEGLRCIYHGWKFSLNGDVTEVPNHYGNEEEFCKRVKVNRYQVTEKAGIVWIWMGEGQAPAFPELPFLGLPEDHTRAMSQEVPTNWVQGVEATVDTTHVSFLHSSTVLQSAGAKGNQRVHMTESRAPRLEFDEQPYGYRYAAIRPLPNDKFYVRVNNFVMPWYGVICPPDKDANAMVFLSVPVDDSTHRAWFIPYNLKKPLGPTAVDLVSDPWNYPPLPPGDRSNNWGQDRELMNRGHFSGFPQHLATEDFSMFLGQGAIYDRTQEQLCSADMAVIRMRNCLLKSVQEFVEGKVPSLVQDPNYNRAISVGGMVENPENWRQELYTES